MQFVTKSSLLLQLFVSIHTIVILFSCLLNNVNLTSASSLKHDVGQKEVKNIVPINPIVDGTNDDEDNTEEKLCISCELMIDSLNTIKILMNKLENVSKKYCSATFSTIEKKTSDNKSRGSRVMTNPEGNDKEQHPQTRWKSRDFMRDRNVYDRYRPSGQAGQVGPPVPSPPQTLPMPRFPTRGAQLTGNQLPRGGNNRRLLNPIKNLTNSLALLNLNVEKQEPSGLWKHPKFIKTSHDGIHDTLRPTSSLMPPGLVSSIPLIKHRSASQSRHWEDPKTQQEINNESSSPKIDNLSQLLTLNSLFPRDEQDIMITENDDIPTIVIHDEKELENYKNEDMVFFLCSKMKNSRRNLQDGDLKQPNNEPADLNKPQTNKENIPFDNENINTNINLNNYMNQKKSQMN